MPNSFTPDFTLILNRPEGADIMEDEWEDICQEIFQDLKAEIEREDLDIRIAPERERMMGSDEFELFRNICIWAGYASPSLIFLLNRLIEFYLRKNNIKVLIKNQDGRTVQIEGQSEKFEKVEELIEKFK